VLFRYAEPSNAHRSFEGTRSGVECLARSVLLIILISLFFMQNAHRKTGYGCSYCLCIFSNFARFTAHDKSNTVPEYDEDEMDEELEKAEGAGGPYDPKTKLLRCSLCPFVTLSRLKFEDHSTVGYLLLSLLVFG
jgi:hypothetical protein